MQGLIKILALILLPFVSSAQIGDLVERARCGDGAAVVEAHNLFVDIIGIGDGLKYGDKVISGFDAERGMLDSNRVMAYLRGIEMALEGRESARVLYVGCGGFLPLYMLSVRKDLEWVVTDINGGAVRRAKELCRVFGFSPEIIEADALEYDYGEFDLVVIATASEGLLDCNTVRLYERFSKMGFDVIPEDVEVEVEGICSWWLSDIVGEVEKVCEVEDKAVMEGLLRTRFHVWGDVVLGDGESSVTMPRRFYLKDGVDGLRYSVENGIEMY